MFSFGKRSRERLETCHEDLQRVLELAIQLSPIDFTILCGHRGQAAQDEAFATGFSKVRWPNGRHNRWPSDAVDVAPWPIDWDDREAFAYLAGVIMACANHLGVELRWGHDWDMDGDLHDHSFVDAPHFERVEERPPPRRIA